MELTIREAAALLGRSPRTVRARVARGDLAGVKRGGQWCIPRHALPLTEAQRRAVQARADEVRHAVDDALPSRSAGLHGERRRSVLDLDAFRLGTQVLAELRAAAGAEQAVVASAATTLESGLLRLCEAVYLFDRDRKVVAVEDARCAVSRAVGLLVIHAPDPLAEPLFGWIRRLEAEVLPALSGFARWAERLPRGRHS